MTETEIANRALLKIGGAGEQINGKGFLNDINAEDNISCQCRSTLPFCRRRAISDLAALGLPFRESLKYADLGSAATSGELPEVSAWLYAFNLPGDYLAMVSLLKQDGTELADKSFETILNKSNNGRLLLTNQLSNSDATSVYIKYTIDQTNLTMYSEALIECIATLMAAELCALVGKDEKMRQQMLVEYANFAVDKAKRFNRMGEEKPKPELPNYSGGRS